MTASLDLSKLKQFAKQCCTTLASDFPAISKIWPLLENCDVRILHQLLSQMTRRLPNADFMVKLCSKPDDYSELLEDVAAWIPTLLVELDLTLPESPPSDTDDTCMLTAALSNLFMGVAGAIKPRQVVIRTTIFGLLNGVVHWSHIRDSLDLNMNCLSVLRVELPTVVVEAYNHQVDEEEATLANLHAVVMVLLNEQPFDALFSAIHPLAYRATLTSEYGPLELNRDPLTVTLGARRFFYFRHYRDVQWTLSSMDAFGQTDYIEITRCYGGAGTCTWGIRTLNQDMDPGTFSKLTVLSAHDSHGNNIPLQEIRFPANNNRR